MNSEDFDKELDNIRHNYEIPFYKTIASVLGRGGISVQYKEYQNLSLSEKERLINSRDALVNAHQVLLSKWRHTLKEDYIEYYLSYIAFLEARIKTEDKK
ncbi:MAG: hypothetical protein ACR2MS_07835 [Weeksellaceae bacterium]